MTWQDGWALLAERIGALPDLIRRGACEAVLPLPFDGRRIVTTGVGSSAAHAHLLAHLLAAHHRVVRAVPLGAFLAPPVDVCDDMLVVFSQGLSPNARLALAHPDRWRQVVVVTAVTDTNRDPEKRRLLATLRDAGARIVRFAGEDEYGTLVRVIGPLAGLVATLEVAHAFGAGLAVPDRDDLALTIGRAADRVPEGAVLTETPAFVTTGTYGDLVLNLRYKVLEGLLQPLPPVWDVVELAHGPLQEAFQRPATFFALTRPDAAGEEDLLRRFAHQLDARRHRLWQLAATLPGPLALLEHEMMLNVLMLHAQRDREVDQVRWPGRGRETPLYEVAVAPSERRLADLTWPEVEDRIARGMRSVVLGLGACEQHGAHLPLATDTWIADALAERVVGCTDDALQGPTLSVGCSREHLAFPGTLDLAPSTLVAVLGDVLLSLRAHGFERAFLFSAHGGNFVTLEEALPELRARTAPMRVTAFTDLAGLMTSLQETSGRFGIAPTAAGHHAGEIETSMLLALRASSVRTDQMAPGHVAPTDNPQALFYPSLRAHAPNGVVGDPRRADAERGARYVEAWVALLLDAYRSEKNAR